MKNSCFIPTEADGRQSTAKLLPRDCDLYRPVPIDSAVPSQGRSFHLYVGLVAHLRQRLDQVLLVGHCCGEFLVLAHGASYSVSRNARLPDAVGLSDSVENTPERAALRNRPDACRRSASIWSAADLETGTMYSADSFSERFNRHALRQHSRISAPVQPSSFGRSPSIFHFAR